MLLFGCVGIGCGGDKSYSDDFVYQKFQEIVKNIQQLFMQFVEVEQYEKMKNWFLQLWIYVQICGMEQVVIMFWYGFFEQVVSKFVLFFGYEVKFMGKLLVVLIFVQIGEFFVSIFDYLCNVGIQVGVCVDIVVNFLFCVVEVRYIDGVV